MNKSCGSQALVYLKLPITTNRLIIKIELTFYDF